MKLKVFVKVAYLDPEIRLSLSGDDIELFKADKMALKRSFEYLVTQYLRNKVHLERANKVNVRLDREQRRENTEKELLELVEKTKTKVLESKEPVAMKSLNPAHRRIVHQAINDDARFLSSSIGDGRFKQVEISLKD